MGTHSGRSGRPSWNKARHGLHLLSVCGIGGRGYEGGPVFVHYTFDFILIPYESPDISTL